MFRELRPKGDMLAGSDPLSRRLLLKNSDRAEKSGVGATDG